MENKKHIPLQLIIILLLTMLSKSKGTEAPNISPTMSPTRQQLSNIIDALIGAGDFTQWVNILSSPNTTTLLPLTATLLVPQDHTVDLPPLDPFILPYHLIPQRLSFSDLLLFPLHARLPTLLPGKTISVTDNSAVNFSLDAIPLTHPDLFSTANLAVHGVKVALDYSIFGDGLPPPPPFLPVGDTIGTAWKSGCSCSQENDVILLFFFLFCVVLRVLCSNACM